MCPVQISALFIEHLYKEAFSQAWAGEKEKRTNRWDGTGKRTVCYTVRELLLC
jgi:cation transport regulator ChaB